MVDFYLFKGTQYKLYLKTIVNPRIYLKHKYLTLND